MHGAQFRSLLALLWAFVLPFGVVPQAQEPEGTDRPVRTSAAALSAPVVLREAPWQRPVYRDALRVYGDEANVSGADVVAVLPREDGSVWAATPNRLLRYDGLTWQPVPLPTFASPSVTSDGELGSDPSARLLDVDPPEGERTATGLPSEEGAAGVGDAVPVDPSSVEAGAARPGAGMELDLGFPFPVLDLAEWQGKTLLARGRSLWVWQGEDAPWGRRWLRLEELGLPEGTAVQRLVAGPEELLVLFGPESPAVPAWTGIARLDASWASTFLPRIPGVAMAAVLPLDGGYWAAGADRILRRSPGEQGWTVDLEVPAEASKSRTVDARTRGFPNHICMGSEGELCASLGGRLLWRAKDGAWAVPKGWTRKAVKAIPLPRKGGGFRVLTQSSGIIDFVLVDGVATTRVAFMQHMSWLTDAAVDRAGNLWLCGQGTLSCDVEKPEWQRVGTGLLPLAGLETGVIARGRDGLYFVHGDRRDRDRKWIAGLGSMPHVDRQHRVWLLSARGWFRVLPTGEVVGVGPIAMDRQLKVLGPAFGGGIWFAQPAGGGRWRVLCTLDRTADPASRGGAVVGAGYRKGGVSGDGGGAVPERIVEPGVTRPVGQLVNHEPLAVCAGPTGGDLCLIGDDTLCGVVDLHSGQTVSPVLSLRGLTADIAPPLLYQAGDGALWLATRNHTAFWLPGESDWQIYPALHPGVPKAIRGLDGAGDGHAAAGKHRVAVFRASAPRGTVTTRSHREPGAATRILEFEHFLGPAGLGTYAVMIDGDVHLTDLQPHGYRDVIRSPIFNHKTSSFCASENQVLWFRIGSQCLRFQRSLDAPETFLEQENELWTSDPEGALRLPLYGRIPRLPVARLTGPCFFEWRTPDGRWREATQQDGGVVIDALEAGRQQIEVRAIAGWGPADASPLQLDVEITRQRFTTFQLLLTASLVVCLTGLLWRSVGSRRRLSWLRKEVAAQQRKLRVAARHQHEMLDALPMPLFRTDPGGGILETNAKFRNLMRESGVSEPPDQWLDLLRPGEQASARKEWRRALHQPTRFSVDYSLPTASATLELVIQLQPLWSSPGEPDRMLEGWLGAVIDGTRLPGPFPGGDQAGARGDVHWSSLEEELVALGMLLLEKQPGLLWDIVVERVARILGVDSLAILDVVPKGQIVELGYLGEVPGPLPVGLLRRIEMQVQSRQAAWWSLPSETDEASPWRALPLHSQTELLGLLVIRGELDPSKLHGSYPWLLGEVLGAGLLQQRATAIVRGRDAALREVGGLSTLTSWTVIPETDEFIISTAAQDLLGLDRWEGTHTEFVNKHLLAEDRATVLEVVAGVARDHQSRQYEHRLVAMDGSVRNRRSWASWVRISGESGIVTGVTVDVTGEVIAGQRNQQLVEALEVADDGVAVAGPEGRIRYANQSLARLLGRPQQELEGLSLAELLAEGGEVNPEDPPWSGGEAWRSSPMVVHGEEQGVQRPTEPFPAAVVLQASVTPQLDKDGKQVVGLLAVFRDVAKETAMERRVQTVRRRAALGELARTVAHDVNNLLLAIRNRAIQLQSEAGELANVDELAQRILESCDRGSEMTRRISQSGKMPRFDAEQVEVGAFLDGLRPVLAGILGPTAQLQVRIAPQVGSWLLDPHLVEHALLNLCANARDARSGRGRVEVAAALEEQGGQSVLVVSVEDDGVGMSPETLRRCQEPFFTTKEPSLGTGLGLAGVTEAVRKHGGRLRLHSVEGEGARMEMVFPGRAATAARSPRSEWDDAKETGLVLVADDETAAREAARVQLEGHGYLVLHADSIASALQVVGAEPVLELAVLDVGLGSEDGRELARRLREIDPQIPLVLCSGDPELLESVDAAGLAAAKVPKPYTAEAFSAAILAALTRIRRQTIEPEG